MFQSRISLLICSFVSVWVLSSLGWAGGSRVGNGNGKPSVKVEIDSNFEITSELPFTQVQRYSDGIRIQGPAKLNLKLGAMGAMVSSQNINIRDLKVGRPEISQLSKEKLEEYFNKNAWTSQKVENPCLQAWTFERDGIVTAIVTAEDGEGFLASADNTNDAKRALEKIVQSAKLKKNCSK